MSKIVLDASAMLAVLWSEPGSEKLPVEMLRNAAGSAVNAAEVHTKLVSRGEEADDAWEDASSAVGEVVPFTAEQAKIAGSLVAQTRALGLSLGDRACLALGIELKAPIYTADKAWKKLNVGVRIHVIR
ncbi:MAG: type II toxin-antitoxin system VapC family toxin [Terriglobales bacterium]